MILIILKLSQNERKYYKIYSKLLNFNVFLNKMFIFQITIYVGRGEKKTKGKNF